MPVDVSTECKVCHKKNLIRIVDCTEDTFKDFFVSKNCSNCRMDFVEVQEIKNTETESTEIEDIESESTETKNTKSKSPETKTSNSKTSTFEWLGMSGVLIFWIFIAIAVIGFILDFFSGGGCTQSASVCSGDFRGP